MAHRKEREYLINCCDAMRNKIAITLFLLCICPQFLRAQNNYDFPQFGRETGLFITQPLRWDGDDWLKLGAVGLATGLATLFDQPTRTWTQNDGGHYYKSVPIEGGRIYGEPYTPIALLAGFASYSLITGDQKARKIGYELGQAVLYGTSCVFLLKILVGRSRPLTDEGPGHFRPAFSFVDDDFHSFPSGHTAIAFAVSTILARNVQPTWAKVLCYLPAVFTPMSRVYQDHHWVSDVVMGGLIGYFFATWVVDQHERNDATAQQKSGLQLSSFFPIAVSIPLN
jgi:membrane-associated phospholipid phosphatase